MIIIILILIMMMLLIIWLLPIIIIPTTTTISIMDRFPTSEATDPQERCCTVSPRTKNLRAGSRRFRISGQLSPWTWDFHPLESTGFICLYCWISLSICLMCASDVYCLCLDYRLMSDVLMSAWVEPSDIQIQFAARPASRWPPAARPHKLCILWYYMQYDILAQDYYHDTYYYYYNMTLYYNSITIIYSDPAARRDRPRVPKRRGVICQSYNTTTNNNIINNNDDNNNDSNSNNNHIHDNINTT